MIRKLEALLLAVVLVIAFHATPRWILHFLPARELYEQWGPNGYATFYDAVSVLMPLLLCLGAPTRCGLSLGVWKGRTLKVLFLVAVPIILTAVVYPFTSRPFSGGRIGSWLVSPAAQDLLFPGYLYGLFDTVFPGPIHSRIRINRAVFLTAFFFALWHVPNFASSMSASYVLFQLLYTSIGGAWMLLTRQLTGSMLPGLAVHMVCNFISWL